MTPQTAKTELKTGRPPGSRTATPKEKIQRSLHGIYDALIKNALAGDAHAARLCFEIAQAPEEFPDAE